MGTRISPRTALGVQCIFAASPFFYILPNNNRKTLLIQKEGRAQMTTPSIANATQTTGAQAGAMPPFVNRMMTWLLRSPFHRVVSSSILTLTFTGRKSGKVYTTLLSYTHQGGQFIVFTHSQWWKNLQGGAPVTVRVQGQDVSGRAEVVAHEPATILPYLRTHLTQLTRDLRYYAVKLDANGKPNEADLALAAAQSVLIRITPTMADKE